MTSYVEVDGRFNQRGFNQAFRNHITDARVAAALWKEIGEKAQIRSKCSSYSRHCLLLVDIVDAVGANGTPVWNGCDLSTFDVVAVVRWMVPWTTSRNSLPLDRTFDAHDGRLLHRCQRPQQLDDPVRQQVAGILDRQDPQCRLTACQRTDSINPKTSTKRFTP